jgi:hypothetical protein
MLVRSSIQTHGRRHKRLPNACPVNHYSTSIVRILVVKVEISEHRTVFSSQFELFEKEQVEFLVALVHDRYL